MTYDLSKFFYYDETSPSCLRWNTSVTSGRWSKIISVNKGDVAGSISNKNEYYRVTFNGKQLKSHRVIYELFYGQIPYGHDIDHIDGDVCNNKIENLRLVSHKENMRNQRKRSTNTSGVTGVYPKTKDGILVSWVADIRTDLGRISKSFSIKKYPNAFELAVAKRDELLSEHGYSDRHGT